MSESNMSDLRREVAIRLKESLDGETIDMMEGIKPRLPHMIGATPLDEVVDPEHFSDTLIDPSHDFWDDYYKDIRTESKSTEEIVTAINTLREQELFRMVYPYGEDGGIVYCEVDDPRQSRMISQDMSLATICKSCGEGLSTSPHLAVNGGYYYLKFTVDCENCDFKSTFEQNLIKS